MVTRGAIGLLHAGVAQTFMGLLEGECEIEPPSEFRANWHRRELEEKISFQLWQKGARQQIGVRTGGGAKCPLVPGQVVNPAWDNGERAWVAWREIWKRESHDAFSLEEAAFTFFWGRPSVEPITNQLFRAEWPQRTIGGKTSASRIGRLTGLLQIWSTSSPVFTLEWQDGSANIRPMRRRMKTKTRITCRRTGADSRKERR